MPGILWLNSYGSRPLWFGPMLVFTWQAKEERTSTSRGFQKQPSCSEPERYLQKTTCCFQHGNINSAEESRCHPSCQSIKDNYGGGFFFFNVHPLLGEVSKLTGSTTNQIVKAPETEVMDFFFPTKKVLSVPSIHQRMSERKFSDVLLELLVVSLSGSRSGLHWMLVHLDAKEILPDIMEI